MSSETTSTKSSGPSSPNRSIRPNPAAKGKRLRLLALAGFWVLVALLTPWIGSVGLSISDLFDPSSSSWTIFWALRWPRVLLALLGGGLLAISGVSFQTLFRNELAEPYTLGVASGAALGAVLALQFGSNLASTVGADWVGWSSWISWSIVAVSSFAGALGATALVVGLAASGRRVEIGALLLGGIAVSLSTSALILLVQYLADATQTFRMVRWMMGGLSVVGYGEVLWLLPFALFGGGFLLLRRWDLNLLLTGEELAASRGVDLRRLRIEILLTTSAMIAALVAVTGPIGFVGLMVPHMLRRRFGPDHLTLIPACFLGGGAFLALADALGRSLMAPAELPVGILTALLGGPFFLFLLLRRR